MNPDREGYYWVLRFSAGEWEPARFLGGRWWLIGLSGPWHDDPIEWKICEMQTAQ